LGVLWTAPLRGQAVASAQISGTITDQTGAAVPNANVTAKQTDTGSSRTTVSGTNGSYTIPNLPVGPYTLDVSAAGFTTYVQKGILLSVGNDVTINVAMQVGSVRQEVEVTANAGMVETRDTSVSQVIGQQQVLDLPLNGREAATLVMLSGASVSAGTFVTTKTYGSSDIVGSSSISVAGGQANWTNFLMDGGDNNHPYANINLPFPFPDAIQEFSVQTNGLSARYGLHPGGVVNIITKSGTNGYHGDVFEFLRNGDLNARNFFAATHDSLQRNQFGGTVGGPIRRDHLFFLFGYQGTRIRTAPPQTISYVPTQAVLSGDFSQLESAACQSNGKARSILNPSTGQAFANDYVSPSLFNPQALALLKYVPVSSDPCGKLIYGIPNPEDENQYIGRVDWNLSAKHIFFGRYFISGLLNPPVFQQNLLLTTRSGENQRSQSVVVGENYSLSPTALNAVHATFTRLSIHRGPAAGDPSPTSVGVNMYNDASDYSAMSVSGYFSFGCGSCAPAEYTTNTMQVADDVDVIRGRHHIIVGGNYIHNQENVLNIFNGNGTFTFSGQSTNDGLLDFMLGLDSSFTQGMPAVSDLRQNYLGAYIQDDVQLTSRLHAHVGLRWEPFLPAADEFDRMDHFDPVAFAQGQHTSVYTNAPPGLTFVGDPGVGRPYANRRMADLEPRIGIAWDPAGNGRQTVRASYSVFYDQPELNYGSHPEQGPPWGDTISITSPPGGLTNPFLGYAGGSPFPIPTVPAKNAAFPLEGVYVNLPQNLKPTYMDQWSVSYQREFADWLFSGTYLGNKTTHLWLGTEEDPAVYIPGTCSGKPCSSTSNTNQRRVLYLENPAEGAYFSTVTVSDGGANAEYDGLLLSARHRLSHNFTLLVNYTYSHCVSEGSFSGELTSNSYQNPYDRDASRGNCPFDLRHIVNASLVALAPHFNGLWMGRVFGNWQISPLVSVHSGSWYSPVSGLDNSLTGVGLDRPNMVAGGSPYTSNLSTLQWLNPAAFVQNPTGTFGNAGAYSLSGPRSFDMDLGVSRFFAVHESQKLEVRFEFFNTTNYVRFANPVATVSNAHFGQIQSAGDPRILQAAMKYHF
jgi:hypothetical protein